MKKILILFLTALCLRAGAQPYGVQIDTNAGIVRGTNFFFANTNLLYPVLPPGGSTGPAGPNGTNGSAWQPLYTWSAVSNFVDFSNAMQFISTTTNVAFFGPSNEPANPTAASVEVLLTNTSSAAITVSTSGFQPVGAATTNLAVVNADSSLLSLFTSEGNGTYTFMNSIPPGMMGAPGTNASFTLAGTIILSNGVSPSVANLGTSLNAILQFSLPVSGTNGVNGLNGASGVVLGQSTTGANGAPAAWMVGLDASGLLTTNAVPSGGGGTAVLPAWVSNSVLTVPSPTNSMNDEFNGPLTNANWVWINQGTVTLTFTNGRVCMVAPAQTAMNRMLVQPLPAAPWQFTVVVHADKLPSSVVIAGLELVESGTQKTQTFFTDNTPIVGMNNWTAYSTFSSQPAGASKTIGFPAFLSPVFLRVGCDGVSNLWQSSGDGVSWTTYLAQSTNGAGFFTAGPNEVGIHIYTSATAAGQAQFDFFRRTK